VSAQLEVKQTCAANSRQISKVTGQIQVLEIIANNLRKAGFSLGLGISPRY